MSFFVKEKSEYIPIPEGPHRSVCSGIVSIGLQESFGATKHQLVMRFEFPDLRMFREEDGHKVNEPRYKWQFYSVTLNSKSNLRQDLERWLGRALTKDELNGFDVFTMLGRPCQIMIIHDSTGDRVKDKITSVSKLIGNGKDLKPELEIIRYKEDEVEQWEQLPNWI